MNSKSTTQHWPQCDGIPGSDQFPNASLPKEYANEGNEFVDDAIRIVDQPLGEINGPFGHGQAQTMIATNFTNEIVNSKIN